MNYAQEANPYIPGDRKTAIFVGTVGRDAGKQYFIKEMPATRGEKWAMKAMSALIRSGLNIGNAAGGGMMALAYYGTRAIGDLPWHELEPLLDEIMQFVWCIADPKNPQASTRPLVESDTSEIMTRVQIRDKFLELTTGFSVAGFLSTLKIGEKNSASDSSTTPTSPQRSAPPSPPARPVPRNLRRHSGPNHSTTSSK